jgi:hypothetical protein
MNAPKKTVTLRKLIKNNDTFKTIEHSQILTELTISSNKQLKKIGIDNDVVCLSKKELKHYKNYVKTWYTKWDLLRNNLNYS